MDIAIPDSVLKVQKFSRYARGFCIFFFIVAALAMLAAVSTVLFGNAPGTQIGFGPYVIAGDRFLTPGAKVWGLIVIGSVFAIIFAGLFHLHGLFRNFIAARIYTRENVKHIRQLGLLALAMAVFQLAIPMVSAALLQLGVIDPSLVTKVQSSPVGPGYLLGRGTLPGFITAGIILLASWIMDLGRQTRDEAEELRRDAELIV